MGNATFSHDAVSLELPMAMATQGNNGYDITKLLAATGDTTLDVGFANTASCQSAITFIDGDAGILRYRGYPIEQLAENSSFLEVSYLVLFGELPTKDQLDAFSSDIAKHHLLDERMREMFRSLPRKSHPMPVLSAGLNALSTFAFSKWGEGAYDLDRATKVLLGSLPTLAAYGYKNSVGEPFLYPERSLSYIENFLRMSFGLPTHPYPFDDAITRALDRPADPARRPRAELHRPRPCVWLARRVRTRLRASRLVSPACGAPPTVARTKPASTCWKRSATCRVSASTSSVRRTRTIPSS